MADSLALKLWRKKTYGGSKHLRWTGRKLGNWRKLILSAEPLCRHCAKQGKTTVATEVDHIKPLESGGDYSVDNAQPLCHDCHVKKTAKDRGYQETTQFTPDGRVIW
jgi:5-methylcytosine-specific restriction endonuclease McrA